jgi:hypothetical protein
MKRSRPTSPPPAPSRLAAIRPLALHYDERPSREDRDYGHTLFTRFLRGRQRP